MARIRGEDDRSPLGRDADRLQPARVTSDPVHLDAGRDHRIPVVEDHALGKDRPDHADNVLDLVGGAHERVAHLAPGGERHLTVLKVEASVREQTEVAEHDRSADG